MVRLQPDGFLNQSFLVASGETEQLLSALALHDA